ncbi:MAG: hypothetical protein MAG453_00071 [Calditrichaeota bacterium]|nr:hypothetical protein [Calditrichota bacterium]
MTTYADRYPRRLRLRKNLVSEIRPLDVAEVRDLMTLYHALDETAVSRLPHDVQSPNFPKMLRRQLEDERLHILVTWHEDDIIGSLSLYRSESIWARHIGNVVFVSHPEYRRFGIATILFEEILPIAQSLGIEKIYAELTRDHIDGIKMLKHFGFSREATLKDHIKDRYGRYRDMRIYSLDTEGAHKAMEELIAGFSDYSG